MSDNDYGLVAFFNRNVDPWASIKCHYLGQRLF